MFQKLHHVAYRCRDAQETVDFYTKVLGLKYAAGEASPEGHKPYGEEVDLIHIFFECGDGGYIAFFDLPSSPPAEADRNTPKWVNHIAFEVPSMDALLEGKRRLEAVGVDVLGPKDHRFCQSIYFFDPNGIRLEIGRLADDAELRRVLEHCEQVNAGEPITIFEMETAAAFCLFAEHEADVVLLETGLGGRLDATNVIDRPVATVITPVSMDHTEFLGNSLTAIAGEKAAIIKRGAPVICAEQAPEAMAVIEAQGKRMRAPLHAAGQQWHVGVERGRLVYQDERGLMDLAAPKLFGRHQFDNAGLAIATLRAIETFRVGMPAFEAGIVNAEWPARMQRLVSGGAGRSGAEGLRDLARWRAQCGRRPRRCGGAG